MKGCIQSSGLALWLYRSLKKETETFQTITEGFHCGVWQANATQVFYETDWQSGWMIMKTLFKPKPDSKGIFYHRPYIYLISYHWEVLKQERRETVRSNHWPEESLRFCRPCILVPHTCKSRTVWPVFECHLSNVSVSRFLCTCT